MAIRRLEHMDTRLTRVEIRSYKSIRKCDLELRNINILIGTNGSGKSNFISILKLLQQISLKELQHYVMNQGLENMFYAGLKETEGISMSFHFSEKCLNFSLEHACNEKLMIHAIFNNGECDRTLCDYVYEIDDTYGVSHAPGYLRFLSEAGKWKIYHFHDTDWRAPKRYSHSLTDTCEFHDDGSNIAPFLYRLRECYPERYRDILTTIKIELPYFSDFVLEPIGKPEPVPLNLKWDELVSLRWKQKGCDKVFGANQLSDGSMRFICLVTLLLQPPELQPSVIIIDEPELGLHPSAISLLSELIHLVSHEKQLIIATHSCDLIDNFDADDVIVTEMTDDGSTYVRLSNDMLKEWLDEYALSAIWKKNIFGGLP